MRTTVTLDADVEALLKNEVHRTRRSFKKVLNEAIRASLKPPVGHGGDAFVVAARSMGLRTGTDPARLAELADELEVEAFLDLSRRLSLENPGS